MIYAAKYSENMELPEEMYKIGITTSEPGHGIIWRPELAPPRGSLKKKGHTFYQDYLKKLKGIERLTILSMVPNEGDTIFLLQESFWEDGSQAFLDWWKSLFGETIEMWTNG